MAEKSLGRSGKRLAGEATAAVGKSSWRSFMPPNANGKFPWRWRWLGVPLLLGACMLSGVWAWGKAETELGNRAVDHLACEDFTPVQIEEMGLDWSYRSVTVNGLLPAGETAERVESIIDNGSTDAACLDRAGIDATDDPGVYGVTVPAAALVAAAAIAAPAPDPTPVPTAVPEPTAVPAPTATPEPEPTATPEPEPTATPEPLPVASMAVNSVFDGETITLSGIVGSEAQRDQLVAAAVAAVGASNVVDELTIDDGEPSAASGERIAELAQIIGAYDLASITDGTASATDDATTYALNARSDAARDALTLPGEGIVSVPEAAAPAFTG